MSAVMQMLSPGDAQRLTQRIKLTASVVRDNLFKLRNLVDEAKNSNVYQILGFPSWTAYLADTLADEPMRLGRDERQELVEYLSGEGLSVRAIAPIVAASVGQVHADKQVFRTEQVPTPSEGEAHAEIVVDEATGEVIDEPSDEVTEPVKTIGLDGKEYTRPTAPAAPRRRSIIDDAYAANTKLWEAIERIRSMQKDDRYSRNKADILAALQPSADLALDVLTNIYPTKEN